MASNTMHRIETMKMIRGMKEHSHLQCSPSPKSWFEIIQVSRSNGAPTVFSIH